MSEFNLHEYCLDVAKRAKKASRALAATPGAQKIAWLELCAKEILDRKEEILAENQKDVAAAREANLKPAMIDRLTLSEKTLGEMSKALREIAAWPEPIGAVIESTVRPNGFTVQKVRAPIGVVFFTYESRPNVTTDAAAICIKSGNAVVLRGGKEALNSNLILGRIIKDAAKLAGAPEDAVQLLDITDRDAVDEFLHLPEYIDVAIPRGGSSLVTRVAREARMPVIKHFAGNCHVYIDQYADLDVAEKVLVNSKCQRLGTCNTAESLVIHSAIARQAIPRLFKALAEKGVEIRGDEASRALSPDVDVVLAAEDDYYEEYLAAIISVKVVDSVEQAIEHINEHSSGHTEAIVSKDFAAIQKFTAEIDSAAVMVNSSTRLHDGGQFGLGAEIGISTDKFHVRGPCGVDGLTSYKYVVYGDGAVRE
ncbi:MAG: glutamate-5-semialdehyde dehydrogenase [Thermoguttaceae bacterium]|nr:glutamate-5-semialdehyde dehydrogenase [Thermoguttaceae bacterium]MBQ3822734.1 glutamate-5-semialdehyde dehydrogenase [Thermoguttaceae bacterium]MBQ4079083.1 glutamate-5-semialdehyde dehydrogenase [Thermoguttaceae bacterium]MBQ4202079.1 glutamate-5-semialdehyde dehydrogenase [Thermoguttaceae bacterium]MBQ5367614.1 glutamate-5-semialdehyde dehydrogenase [Thermoguttaceae bacterium]